MTRAYTVYEDQDTRKMQIQTPGVGSTVFTYEFIIRPTTGTQGTDNEEYQAAYNALQTYLGVPIGKLTDISAYSQSPFGDLGSVRSINMEFESASDHVYRAAVAWQSEFPAIYSATDTDVLVASGQAAINYSSQPSVRMMDLYKVANRPTIAQQTAAETAGGYYHSSFKVTSEQAYDSQPVYDLDMNGRPVKYPVAQFEVVIDEPWCSKASLQTDTPMGQWPAWNGNSTFMFKRNDAAYMNFPAGTLLYMGTTTSPRQFHTHTLSHRFIYDEFQHFEQQTFQSLYGITNSSAVDDIAGTGLGANVALNVYWLNYYGLADFSTFVWGNAATDTQVGTGIVDWTTAAGPITR